MSWGRGQEQCFTTFAIELLTRTVLQFPSLHPFPPQELIATRLRGWVEKLLHTLTDEDPLRH
jgi:hypothetical protein